jgi:hypothetical protein
MQGGTSGLVTIANHQPNGPARIAGGADPAGPGIALEAIRRIGAGRIGAGRDVRLPGRATRQPATVGGVCDTVSGTGFLGLTAGGSGRRRVPGAAAGGGQAGAGRLPSPFPTTPRSLGRTDARTPRRRTGKSRCCPWSLLKYWQTVSWDRLPACLSCLDFVPRFAPTASLTGWKPIPRLFQHAPRIPFCLLTLGSAWGQLTPFA